MKNEEIAKRIEQFENRAVQVMRLEGMRVTEGRKAILRLLGNSQYAMSVKVIHDKLIQESQSIDLVTVYRTVSVLCSKNLVHHIGSVDGYTACCLGEHEHSVGHSVCIECGKVDELEVDMTAFDSAVKSARRLGLTAGEVRVEITGLCTICGGLTGI